MADVLTIDDLITDKKHSTFFAEVVTGKAGGISSGADISTSTNQVTGQVQKTLPQVLADLGMVVQTWTATSGGTLTNAAQVFLNDKAGSTGLGNYYAWSGNFPKVVTAGLDPAITAGFIMRSDAGLRAELNVIIKSFNSVSEMINDPALTLGMLVKTVGYHGGWAATAKPVSGANLYEIVAAGTGTPDGGAYITLTNGLLAKGLFIDGVISVAQFGAKGDNNTDDTQALQAALNTGRRITFDELVYKTTATLTSNGLDFIMVGESENVISEKNNQENNFTGTVINYFGPDNTPVISPLNTATTNQIVLKNIRIVAPKTLTTNILNLPGTRVISNDYTSGVVLDNVAIQTRGFSVSGGALAGYTMTALNIDCSNGYGFGWDIKDLYIFGVQTGISVTASGTGFFNSNTFRHVKMYQVYRALHLYGAGGTATVYANLFDGLYIQPNTQLGAHADGVVLLDGAVEQNVFIAPNVYDTNSGKSFKTINNGKTWGKENIFIGAQANDLVNGTITLPGYGLQSDGHFLGRMFEALVDATKDAMSKILSIQDQNSGWVRYPRNGATNDLIFGVSHADKFGIDGATGQKKSVVVGGAVLFQEYGCRGFVNFNGATGTIRSSGNIASVTRTNTGRYTVTMATAMPDKNFCVNVSAGYHVGSTDSSYCNADQFANWLNNSFNITCKDDSGTYYDPDVVCATVFR